MPKLLDYAVYNSFFHRSDRTVHEQVLFRLESKSHPVTYFDIVEGKVVKKTAEEMRQDILAATSALKSYGIVRRRPCGVNGFKQHKILGR